jgi:hypothetical protein
MSIHWRDTTVASAATHHLHRGQPLYDSRFDEVLKFHAPGLAPVLDASGGYHIDLFGRPAYARRFQRTFGYYEGVAAVAADDGWVHIDPIGQDVYAARWAWCGNFQGGRCAVRSVDGRYGHIAPDGTVLGRVRWRYAGDFRDGIAVVQAEDGRSTHIDHDGELVHEAWFEDLDVFHKSYARAHDSAGWTHVDGCGQPVYDRRFANVEPFYNGQARVERFDGGLEVIDEKGVTLVELRPARRSPFAALSADMVGFWRTDAIAGAVEIGIIEALPGSTEDLARRMAVHAGRLGTLLRALVELDIVELREREWATTPRGAYLRRDHPLTLADAAPEYAGPMRDLWAQLPDALRNPDWAPPDIFGDVAGDDARVQSHHRMLRSYARHDYPGVPAALGLHGDERVLDVGGGVGVLAGMLLDRHPGLDVIVLDLPEVVAQLPSRSGLSGLAVDLFGDWSQEADVAVHSRVLHDWPDEQALSLLRRVHENLPQGGRVFVVEMLVSGEGRFGGLCDLHLLMATGGRERSEREYRELLDRAGFKVVGVRGTGGLPMVIEGVAR